MGTPKCWVQVSRMDSSGLLIKTLEDLNLFLYHQRLKSRSHTINGNLELTLAVAARAVAREAITSGSKLYKQLCDQPVARFVPQHSQL